MSKEKLYKKGMIIYESFVKQFGFNYSTPRTNTLELFAILRQRDEEALLIREVFTEFLTNFSDEEIFVKNGKLYTITKVSKLIKN